MPTNNFDIISQPIKIKITILICSLIIYPSYANSLDKKSDKIAAQIIELENKIFANRTERFELENSGYAIADKILSEPVKAARNSIKIGAFCYLIKRLSFVQIAKAKNLQKKCYSKLVNEVINVPIQYKNEAQKFVKNVSKRIDLDEEALKLENTLSTIRRAYDLEIQKAIKNNSFEITSPDRLLKSEEKILVPDSYVESNKYSGKWDFLNVGNNLPTVGSCIDGIDNVVCIGTTCISGELRIGLFGTAGKASAFSQAQIDVDVTRYKNTFQMEGLPIGSLSYRSLSSAPLTFTFIEAIKSGTGIKFAQSEGNSWIFSLSGSSRAITSILNRCS